MKFVVSFLLLCLAFTAELDQVNNSTIDKPNGLTWDYCSITHSAQIAEEAENYFIEVFEGYDVPMSPLKCPFYPLRLKAIKE